MKIPWLYSKTNPGQPGNQAVPTDSGSGFPLLVLDKEWGTLTAYRLTAKLLKEQLTRLVLDIENP